MAPLSIHRYFAVEVPLSFQEVMTRLRILISITILWIYAVHFSLLPLVDWVDSRYQIYLYDLGCFLHSVPGYFHGVWRDFQIDSRAYQDARTMWTRSFMHGVWAGHFFRRAFIRVLGIRKMMRRGNNMIYPLTVHVVPFRSRTEVDQVRSCYTNLPLFCRRYRKVTSNSYYMAVSYKNYWIHEFDWMKSILKKVKIVSSRPAPRPLMFCGEKVANHN